MATTTNYSWTTPDDTDLVKDGAAAIRTLGSSIDTTTKNLNPQTTTGAIAYRSATSNVNTSLAIGTAGQVLKVNSGATAPEWGSIASGGMTVLASGSLSGSTLSLTTIDGTYNNLQLVLRNFFGSADTFLKGSINSTTGIYGVNANGTEISNAMTTTKFDLTFSAVNFDNTTGGNSCILDIYDYANTTAIKTSRVLTFSKSASADFDLFVRNIVMRTTSAITQLDVELDSGTFSGGTYILYGVK